MNAENDQDRTWRMRNEQAERVSAVSAKYGLYGLPEVVNGKPVIAAIRLPDREGLIKGQHVVICREVQSVPRVDTDCGANHAYIVWYVWPNTNPELSAEWIAHQGNYDMTLDRALDEFKRRCFVDS